MRSAMRVFVDFFCFYFQKSNCTSATVRPYESGPIGRVLIAMHTAQKPIPTANDSTTQPFGQKPPQQISEEVSMNWKIRPTTFITHTHTARRIYTHIAASERADHYEKLGAYIHTQTHHSRLRDWDPSDRARDSRERDGHSTVKPIPNPSTIQHLRE